MSAKSIGFATRILSVFLVLSLSMGPLGIIPARAAGILHVTPDGTGTCSDWVNACSLQTALTDAVSGDEIWVQAGLYKPTTDSDRSATFQLKSGVAVYGGFAGTESARSERHFATNVTTLSGDLSGNDNDTILPDEPTRTENSYHVVTGASDAILDGFTVTAGNANGATEGTDQGGGLYNIHSNTIIQNVIFSRNTAVSTGGGIYDYMSQPELEHVTFINNWGSIGGGMFNHTSSPTLIDVTFSNNSSYMGGGMRNMYNSSPSLTRVTFSQNSANIGGGMNNYLDSNPILTDVIFTENTSTVEAGLGGGMHNSESAPILTNVTFDRNIAIYGGGIHNYISNPTLINVTFSGNSAISGGGEHDDFSNPTILNSTFTGNSATDRGGGIFNTSLPFQIDNTIFWGNTAPNGGSQIMSYGGNIRNTVLQGGCPEGLTCTNIITADPKLGTLGDYGGFTPTIPLLAGSSAIDAGDDVACPTTDQRGISRPQGAHCDIGAYESQSSNVLYATPGGLTSGACSSWITACDLQYALTYAVSGQEIWVAAGTYKPTNGTDRAATFQLKSGVAVYGGFAGTESARSERDFATNITTLSGDLSGNDNDTILPGEPTRADNSYHVVTGASGAILDGFTVTAGNANGSPFPNDSGGGFLDIYSGSILTNILFLRNTTSTGGGGMFSLNSDTVLTDVTFRENNALYDGGGICSLASNLTITRGIFDNNSAASTGGGMYALQENTSLTDVAFIGNTADMGGGLYNVSDGLMNNITFFDNSAVTYGGGMMNRGLMTVNNATFTGNSADNGGGIADTSGRASTLTNITFNGNTARTNGGAVYNLSSYVTIRNSILWGNTDLSGFQVYGDGESRISDSVLQGYCSIYSICTNIITTNPLLGTLGDHGGFTQTIPIEEGSPAIDATSNNCPATDQRGLPRSNPACDIGAYELQPSNVLYATPGGLTSGACSSWITDCDLQYALTNAVSGDEIWVAAGTYKPTNGTDRAATFQLKSGVAVYGGFAGTESARSERDFATNVTTLSGDLSGNDNDSILPGEPTRADNSYHVVTGASGAILDGFTVTAGNANGETSSYHGGGGLYNFQSDPVIQNVIFSSNTAHYAGGGIYDYESQPQLVNIVFINNWAGIGGGMDNDYSSPILTNVSFVDNSAYMGAGMRNNFGSSPTLTNVTFKNNSADHGGGLNNCDDSNPILISVVFNGNTARGDNNGSGGNGGAMLNVENSKPILVNVEFLNNTADYGGGISNYYSSATLTNVTFSKNSAMYGGGIYGTYDQYHISELTNVTFTDNSADGYYWGIRRGYGGGIYAYGGNLKLLNVTFSSNTAFDSGGGIYTTNGALDLKNSTFTNNSANYSGGGILDESSGITIKNSILWQNISPHGAQIYSTYNTPNISDSVVQGGYAGGTNIITDDPLLGTLGDYGGFTQTLPIEEGSSAIDATSNNCPATDQRGLPRSNPACDIGAYEAQPSNVLYATPGGLTSGTCSSWITACDLQYALASAVSGQEIWVKAGVYKPTTATDRAATFQLKSGVAVYGGFAGTESARDQRNFVTNVTILSGDLNGDDLGFANNSENVYHVVTGVTGAILNGFTITAGNANGLGSSDQFYIGGGMYNATSSPSLMNVIFIGNWAYYGGGMGNYPGSPTLMNVTFSGNSAYNSGGGMFNQSNSNPILMNVTFSGNSAISNGGSAMFDFNSSPTLTNVTFSGNSTLKGVMINMESSSPTLTNVTFSGGMYNFFNSNPQIRNSIFWDASIINDNYSSPVVGDSVFQGGYTGGTNIIITDPHLGMLGDYGGDTQTIPIQAGSSALDAGSDLICPQTDQRGIIRPQGEHCDIGAYEFEDTTAPATIIDLKPASYDSDNTPTFNFSGNDGAGSGVASFLCGIDNDAFAPCTSPFTSYTLTEGPHDFEVYAIDALGNADETPASYTWSVDTVVPQTAILTTPPALDNDNTPTFTFDGNDGAGSGVASFLCKVDNDAFAPCTSPFTSPALEDGSHTFEVYALDLAGNADPSPAVHAWSVETEAPIVLSITRASPNPTDLASVDFTVTFSEPVTGVDGSGPDFDDFILTTSAGISNASVTAVNGSGETYTVTVATGSGNGTLRLDLVGGVNIQDTANNPLAGGFTTGEVYSTIKTATFTDVPLSHWANQFIEPLYYNGITGGCSNNPLMYCPEATVTRAQMAVFLLVAEHGTGYTPPPATGLFNDVPASNGFAKWIEQLYNEGITGGCGGGNYCPNSPVTREQMAVFLLVAEHGTGYTPPAATGVFADVPADYPFAPWIEQLAAEGITGGCGGGNFCPKGTVTRAQMAVFLVAAFNLP